MVRRQKPIPSTNEQPTPALLARVLGGPRSRERARQLLDHAGSLCAVAALNVGQLLDLGLSPTQAHHLRACLDLGRRSLVAPPAGANICEPIDAYGVVASRLVGQMRERFVVVVLDVKNRPQRISTLATGSVDGCCIDAREVFRLALAHWATGVLVAHNHPSGDPEPSPEDIALTARLARAGNLLGIPLLDHLIVGHAADCAPCFVSLAQLGLLPTSRPSLRNGPGHGSPEAVVLSEGGDARRRCRGVS